MKDTSVESFALEKSVRKNTKHTMTHLGVASTMMEKTCSAKAVGLKATAIGSMIILITT